MTARFILIGRGDAINRQLSAMRTLGWVPSGPKFINSEGGSKSRQHEQHCLTFTDGGASPQAPAVDPLPR
jgi:hypothetical protein